MSVAVRVDRQPAFVLHSRAYRESSLLLDLLTRDFGRIGVVARGARSGCLGERKKDGAQVDFCGGRLGRHER